MPKPKLTEGWLCRDDVGLCLVHFEPHYPTIILKCVGYWSVDRSKCRTWTPKQFKAAYNFPIPRRGTKQLVDIEL